jgi:ABC-type glycerol-3-phosphate transport system permease component
MERQWVRSRSTISRAAHYALLTIVAVFCISPLYTMLIDSFRSADQFGIGGSLAPPINGTIDNYRLAWSDLGFGRMTLNSALLACLSTAISTVLSATAAFAFARLRVPAARLWLLVFIGCIAIPPIVVIVPLFRTAADLGLINTLTVGVLGEVGLLVPFATYLVYSYMQDLPSEQFEAAAIDGAGTFRQFVHIAIPLSRPAIVTSAVLSFVFVWNDLLIPLIFWPRTEMQTLMTGLATLGPGRTGLRDVPLLMAGVMISFVPLLVLFVLSRRTLAAGLTEGGSKA